MKEDMVLRVVRKDEAETVYQVMQEVYERLENKALFANSDMDYIRAHIET